MNLRKILNIYFKIEVQILFKKTNFKNLKKYPKKVHDVCQKNEFRAVQKNADLVDLEKR